MFITRLVVVFDSNGEGATLDSDLMYQDGDHLICVPSGFHTDFGSVPGDWVLPALVPKVFRYANAFILHDWLYVTCGDNGWYTRRESDALLRTAMMQMKKYRLRPVIAYYGVRVGGWKPWRKYCQEMEAE